MKITSMIVILLPSGRYHARTIIIVILTLSVATIISLLGYIKRLLALHYDFSAFFPFNKNIIEFYYLHSNLTGRYVYGTIRPLVIGARCYLGI